jgi:signal transduction histidine kinase
MTSMSSIEKAISEVRAIAAVPTILNVVCRTTGMGFAAVARVTGGRWVACALLDNIDFGLKPGGELKVETTICHEIRQSAQAVIIDDVDQDGVYCRHPTPAMYGFKSYISMPIVQADGTFFGTLCAIDPKPRPLKASGAPEMFKLFAQMIAYHLDAQGRVDRAESSLADEKAIAVFRDQFIAVLGHDIRNPLGAVSSGIHLLESEPQSDRAMRILNLMQGSVIRMTGLIDNVLDFARTRLGGGITLYRSDRPLEPTLRQVVSELRLGNPDRIISEAYDLPETVNVDHGRIGQLLSNLVGNALRHGLRDTPISVVALVTGGTLSLSVANASEPIPDDVLPRLFQPFVRGADSNHREGLGLGLHISAEIARAHEAELTVSSDEHETRFAFIMPMRTP